MLQTAYCGSQIANTSILVVVKAWGNDMLVWVRFVSRHMEAACARLTLACKAWNSECVP